MPLGSSGTSISFSQIQQEFGGTNPISASEYFRDGDNVPDFTSGRAEVQEISYSGTKSNTVFAGTAETVVLSLPTNFNSGGADTPGNPATNAVISKGPTNHFSPGSGSGNEWRVVLKVRRVGTNSQQDITFPGVCGTHSDFGSFYNPFPGGSHNAWDKFYQGRNSTYQFTTSDFFNAGISGAVHTFRNGQGTSMAVTTNIPQHVTLPTNGQTIISVPGTNCNSRGPGQGIGECSGSSQMNSLVGQGVTVNQNIAEANPTITRDASQFTVDLDSSGTDFASTPSNVTLSDNLGPTAALTAMYTSISQANSTVSGLTNQGVTASGTNTIITISTGELSDITDASFTMNARDGTNVSPTVSVTDGAAPIGNAQSTFVITDYGGTQIQSFTGNTTSDSGTDIQTRVNNIVSQIQSNTESPVNFSAQNDTGNSKIIITGAAGAITGLFSATVDHSGGNGNAAFTTAVQTTRGIATNVNANIPTSGTISLSNFFDGDKGTT